MTKSHPGNAACRWTTIFLRTLLANGVQHIVISPGSRSTPLTLSAAANKRFQKHIILDERSAAFTALGISKATNYPALLICTSGTAAANYYPAIIEARQSGIPLIVATADRPPNLRATGANQAIDQIKMFGDYPVFFHEVGEPATEKQDLERLQLLGRQTVSISREKRGPAHLNFAFRKPLEPEPDFLKTIRHQNDAYTPGDPEESFSHSRLLNSVIDNIKQAQKPLVITGPLAPQDEVNSIASLSDKLGAPLLSESTINSSNAIHGFAGFLRYETLLDHLEPDLILRFGFQPTTKALELGLNSWKPKNHYHFASTADWHDATYSGAQRIPWMGKPITFGDNITPTNADWFKRWLKAESNFKKYYRNTVSQHQKLTDGAVYNALTPKISNDSFITVSNSFPARDIFLFGQQSDDIPLFLNRGASGIDGVTSTAIGISLALKKPGILFTGDLAFLHDTNSLLNHKKLDQPLTIIVINNSGGSIFRMLPIEQQKEYFETYFETPQSAEIGQLIRAYGIPYQQIDSLSSLQDINLQQWQQQHNQLSVIECTTDADASMQLRKKLWKVK